MAHVYEETYPVTIILNLRPLLLALGNIQDCMEFGELQIVHYSQAPQLFYLKITKVLPVSTYGILDLAVPETRSQWYWNRHFQSAGTRLFVLLSNLKSLWNAYCEGS